MPSLRSWGVVGLCGLLLGVVTACSAPGRSFTQSTMQETLDIEILPNTSKMFVYNLKWPENEIPSLVRIERGSSLDQKPKPGGIDIGSSTQKRLRENAAYVVKQMGYCRDGFLEIDSSTSRYHLWLKGECKEGATDADREKFGAKQTLAVSISH